jgi:Protein of unknown function (DUF732)
MRLARPALLLAVLPLAACTAGPRPVAAPPPVPTPAQAETDAGSGDPGLDRFVAAVQRKLPDVAMDRRDEEVAALGRTACDRLAAGSSPAAITHDLADQGITPAEAHTLLSLARTTACDT